MYSGNIEADLGFQMYNKVALNVVSHFVKYKVEQCIMKRIREITYYTTDHIYITGPGACPGLLCKRGCTRWQEEAGEQGIWWEMAPWDFAARKKGL